MKYYICPVCGYDKLDEPPVGFTLCSCCGTEFELDDDEMSHAELRDRWIVADMPWFSPVIPRPVNWNPAEQLRRAGFGAALYSEQSVRVFARPLPAGRFRLATKEDSLTLTVGAA
jgi:hypothetical protein